VRNKTPQEKKRLSYERDRRNAYGESDKGSRKSIPLHKRKVVRAYRKLTKQQLPKNELALDLDRAEAADASVRGVGRKSWRKVPDIPLGEFVARQKQARLSRAGRKTASKASSRAWRIVSAWCSTSGVLNAADVSLSTMRSGSFGDGWRHWTTFTLVHLPTGMEVRARDEQRPGLTRDEYLEATARVLDEALTELETRVARTASSQDSRAHLKQHA